jgi:hypothetical protein
MGLVERRFELVENQRRPFVASVQLRWTASDNAIHSATGFTVDASVYGLGVVIDKPLVAGIEATVWIDDTIVCGTGNVRYSHAVDEGFRTGLQFQTILLMQGIPQLDAILMDALKPKGKERLRQLGYLRSFFKSFAAHG